MSMMVTLAMLIILVMVETVDRCLRSMKLQKAAGFDGIGIEPEH